ncbi:hypothetical protein J4418_02695 [Candidatus Woesearchaeota archaeon]|nr:hypothetical protein [Candidatus Woesearchaeota archaeon]
MYFVSRFLNRQWGDSGFVRVLVEMKLKIKRAKVEDANKFEVLFWMNVKIKDDIFSYLKAPSTGD